MPQEFQMKMETLQQRRDELERKEQRLKESLFKFDKFLKVSSSFLFITFLPSPPTLLVHLGK